MSQAQTTELKREIARITSTYLGAEDHGLLTAWLNVDYGGAGGAGQGVGGYLLDEPSEPRGGGPRRGTAEGMEFVARVIRACGVNSWERVTGRTIYVLKDQGRICGIENLPTEPGERFIFADVFGPVSS